MARKKLITLWLCLYYGIFSWLVTTHMLNNDCVNTVVSDEESYADINEEALISPVQGVYWTT